MLIKSMARKSPTFGQLLDYMTIPEQTAPSILHNLQAAKVNLAAIHREFLDNYRYLPPRKNGNVLYHEILSFSDRDQSSITPSIMEDLARKYLNLRAPCALAFAQAHLSTACPHMHIMISANEVVSPKRLRLSRAEFAGVKRSLEKYQKERYPFLENSVVFERSSPRKKRSSAVRQLRNESERDRRLVKENIEEPSQKEQVRDLVAQQLTNARSGTAFFLRLKNLGLLLYRHGKHVGVHDLAGRPGSDTPGRRYRLNTLGLDDAFTNGLKRWKVSPQRLMILEEQDLERARKLWYEQGYRAHMMDIIALHRSELLQHERERMAQISSSRSTHQPGDRTPPEQSL